MFGKKGLLRGCLLLAALFIALTSVSCVEVADPYYGDPYYYGPPPPPPPRYGGGGYYGGGHGYQADERRQSRGRQNCNAQWSNCVAVCNQFPNPSQRAMCIASCNNGLNQCMNSF
ncbi:hypothetical protein [Desulfolutivibrio sp.]|uniref:hypothetical protein n=1 Tax=Desulfolutivibrio sp. TaxID=2773296 RepID=UPI002F96C3A6